MPPPEAPSVSLRSTAPSVREPNVSLRSERRGGVSPPANIENRLGSFLPFLLSTGAYIAPQMLRSLRSLEHDSGDNTGDDAKNLKRNAYVQG